MRNKSIRSIRSEANKKITKKTKAKEKKRQTKMKHNKTHMIQRHRRRITIIVRIILIPIIRTMNVTIRRTRTTRLIIPQQIIRHTRRIHRRTIIKHDEEEEHTHKSNEQH